MDIVHSERGQRRRRRWKITAAVIVGIVAVSTLAVGRLESPVPSVDASSLLIDTVRRGPMVRQVRAHGSLVPEQVQWISAASDGRVERIAALPGSALAPDAVLLVLSNAELQQSAFDAQSEAVAAEAELAEIRARVESQLMQQQAAAAAVASEHKQAALQLTIDEKLSGEGLVSPLVLNLSRTKTDELAARHALARQQLAAARRSLDAQLAAQRARVDQARALATLRSAQSAALEIRAGIAGVLQELLVEPGQQVAAGAKLARLADPSRVMARLNVPESQARDLRIGQRVEIDTHDGVVPGRVARIDPAVQNRTVAVDVRLDGPLPHGARADQSIVGTIEIERLADVLYVGRPATAADRSRTALFKLGANGREAVRVPVDLGAGSVSAIQVLHGLAAGDRVILSDTSQWEETDRLRLE
jgi:HlyD family secretion protein